MADPPCIVQISIPLLEAVVEVGSQIHGGVNPSGVPEVALYSRWRQK